MNDKRGLAAETAIITMMIVAALCMVLLVVAQLMQKTALKDYASIVATAETDQIAEDFVFALSEENFPYFDLTDFKNSYGDFAGTVDVKTTQTDENSTLYTLTVVHDEIGSSLIVEVRLTDNDGVLQSKLVSWKRIAL